MGRLTLPCSAEWHRKMDCVVDRRRLLPLSNLVRAAQGHCSKRTVETAASGYWRSPHAETRCTRTARETSSPSSSTSGVRNTAMMWLCGRRFGKPEKKARQTGYIGSCLHLEHLQRITSHRNAQFGRRTPSRGRFAPSNKWDCRKDAFLKRRRICKKNMHKKC